MPGSLPSGTHGNFLWLVELGEFAAGMTPVKSHWPGCIGPTRRPMTRKRQMKMASLCRACFPTHARCVHGEKSSNKTRYTRQTYYIYRAQMGAPIAATSAQHYTSMQNNRKRHEQHILLGPKGEFQLQQNHPHYYYYYLLLLLLLQKQCLRHIDHGHRAPQALSNGGQALEDAVVNVGFVDRLAPTARLQGEATQGRGGAVGGATGKARGSGAHFRIFVRPPTPHSRWLCLDCDSSQNSKPIARNATQVYACREAILLYRLRTQREPTWSIGRAATLPRHPVVAPPPGFIFFL